MAQPLNAPAIEPFFVIGTTSFVVFSTYILISAPPAVTDTIFLVEGTSEPVLLLNGSILDGRGCLKMRPLTEDEIKLVLEKLSKL